MKPCYYYGEELLVLAEILEVDGNWWQSCKTRITQGEEQTTETHDTYLVDILGFSCSQSGAVIQ